MSTLTNQPKRVILRLRANEFEGRDLNSEFGNAIKAYLAFAGRPTSEHEENKHYIHIEPPHDIPNSSFHITLDLEKDRNSSIRNLPHEIYRVRRDRQGNL